MKEFAMEKSPFKKRRNAAATSPTDHSKREIRAGFYIRVSTEEQAENPEGSIKNQEERLNYAAQMRTTDVLPWRKIGVYCDAGLSGKDMRRPELKRLIRDIESGEINMLMVSELSRLTRSNKDFAELWEFLQANKCGFMSLRENFDTSTAAGEMLLYQIANFAQFERRQTSERVSANFEARAKRGLWNGGVLPMGYEPNPEKRGTLRIVEEEAQVVRAAFHAVITQGSVAQAAKWLNQNGYAYGGVLRGGGFRPRLKHFTFSNLFLLASNKSYTAIRRIKTKDGWLEGEACWPPIIDRKTFAEVQKILEAGRRQKTGRESRYPYLLSTRIYCDQCGCCLVGMGAYSGTGVKVGYYEHGAQARREYALAQKGPRCVPFRVSAKKLETRVWETVVGVIEGTHRKALYQAVQHLGAEQSGMGAIERKEIEKSATESKIATLARRVANLPEGVPADALYEEMKRLNTAKNRLDQELSQLRQETTANAVVSPAQYERLLAKLKSAVDANQDLTPDTRRRVIQALIQEVRVTPRGFKLKYFAGVEQTKTGEVLASPAVSLQKLNSVPSSFINLNGGPTRTRTWDRSVMSGQL